MPRASDALTHRFGVERALDSVDPAGLRSGEILLVRRLSGVVRAGAGLRERLRRGVEEELATLRSRALRVSGPADATADSEALLFASLETLLLCLALDLEAGVHHSRWYWREIGALLQPVPGGAGDVLVHWPTRVPGLMALARASGVLGPVAQAISESDAEAALLAMAQAFSAPGIADLVGRVACRTTESSRGEGAAGPPSGPGSEAGPAMERGRGSRERLGGPEAHAPARRHCPAADPGGNASVPFEGPSRAGSGGEVRGSERGSGPARAGRPPNRAAAGVEIRGTEPTGAGPLARALLAAALALEACPGAVGAAAHAGLAAAMGAPTVIVPPAEARPGGRGQVGSAQERGTPPTPAARDDSPVSRHRGAVEATSAPGRTGEGGGEPAGREAPGLGRPAELAAEPPTHTRRSEGPPPRPGTHQERRPSLTAGGAVSAAGEGELLQGHPSAGATMLDGPADGQAASEAPAVEPGGSVVHGVEGAAVPVAELEPSVHTRAGGVFYLLNVIQASDALRTEEGRERLEALGGWGVFLQLASGVCRRVLPLHPSILDDPLWPLLAGLAGVDHPPPPTPWSHARQRDLAHRVRKAVWPSRSLRRALSAVLVRAAEVTVDATHADVRFRLDDAELRLRRVGLDLDPGWLPWLGRVVLFHYD